MIPVERRGNLWEEIVVAVSAVSICVDRLLLCVSYFCGLLIASILHRSDFAQIGLLISCIAAMLVAALRQAQADMNRAIAFHQRDLRAQRSDRLLREYEQSGRGWFWETDRHGSIDRKSVVQGKRVSGGLVSGGGRIIKKKKK